MAPKKKPEAEGGADIASPPAKKTKKEKAAVPDHIPQTPAARQHPPSPSAGSNAADGRVGFKAVAWNVAGLRSLLEKQPGMLRRIVEAESPDVICMQEHKLQQSHVEEVVKKLRELLPEYPTAHFAVSTAKKGYSGVAVLARAELAGPAGPAAGGGEGGAASSAGHSHASHSFPFTFSSNPSFAFGGGVNCLCPVGYTATTSKGLMEGLTTRPKVARVLAYKKPRFIKYPQKAFIKK